MNRFAMTIVLVGLSFGLAASGPFALEDPSSDGVPDGHLRALDCPAWVEERYRIGRFLEELELDLDERHATIRACVEHDAKLMKPVIPVAWCENILKVHCSALDVLTEIGELLIERCERQLTESLGVNARQHKAWRTCGANAVFDGYSRDGVAAEDATCRDALLEACGASIDSEISGEKLSPERTDLVNCCYSTTLDPDRGDSGRCAMIDDAFARGPCLDQPVCVDRFTSEWLTCSR